MIPAEEVSSKLKESGRRFVLGITGPYAGGKSSLASEIETLCGPGTVLHIEVDRLGHQALEQSVGIIAQEFGDEVIDSGGKVDRKALGRKVFSDPGLMRKLESITHPPMVREANTRIQDFPGGLVILNAAVLFQMGLEKSCDWVVLCSAPSWLRARRALKRDGLPRSEIRKRIRAQEERAAQLFPRTADIRRVENLGGKRSLHAKAKRLLEELWSKVEVSS